jgi:X-X-X-Leu-X-X-Gly heptad repeat protein
VTFADTADASPELAWDVMIAANSCPSCSRLIRLAMGVLGLKKAVQLAAMIDWVEELADAAGELADAAGELADAAGEDVFGAELVLLLPQAATPAPRTHARKIPHSAL